MMDQISFFEWATHYFNHKDIIEKKLKSIEQTEEALILTYSDKINICFITEIIDESLFLKLDNLEKYAQIYVLCSKLNKNVDFLIKNWKNFLIKNLIFIFVDLNLNTKVLLKPYVHNMICDANNISNGVRTLFTN